jgi:hypothetical protein
MRDFFLGDSAADGGFSCTFSSLKQKVRVDHYRLRLLDPQRSRGPHDATWNSIISVKTPMALFRENVLLG